MGWTYAFLNQYDPKNCHESYSSGVLPEDLSKLQPDQRRGVNGRWCIDEVGVDLELCVHAHGNDVDPIIEASRINNHSFCGLIWYLWSCPLQSWFRPCCPTLISFSDELKYLSSSDQHVGPNLKVDLPPSIIPCSSRISRSYITSYELLVNYDIFINSSFLVFELLDTRVHR